MHHIEKFFYLLSNNNGPACYLIYSLEEDYIYLYNIEDLKLDSPTYDDLRALEETAKYKCVATGDASADLANSHVEVNDAINNANMYGY